MKYIGIDGGGTKTKFVLYDENGNIMHEIVNQSVHILTQSEEICIDILRKNVLALDSSKQAIIIAGLAGYGNQKELRHQIENICKKAFDGYQYLLYNDVQIALMGALAGQDGIVVIAGTGSIAFSYVAGQSKRCGGWGYQLGDEGSAYWIGCQLLQKYCQQVDGRLPRTLLYHMVKEYCGLMNDYDMIQYRHRMENERKVIAHLAKLNYELAKQNDPYALQIYQDAAHHLASLIWPLAKDFKYSFILSYIGGVFLAKDYILKPLKKELSALQVQIQSPIFPPEYGAYLLGKEYIKKNAI